MKRHPHNIEHVIFDLTGVVFLLQQTKLLHAIGIRDALAYMLTYQQSPLGASF